MENIPEEVGSVLAACPLFIGLREDELSELLEISSARLRNFTKGEIIAQAGEEVFFLHIMIQGSVKGEMVDFAGKVIKIEDIVPPRPNGKTCRRGVVSLQCYSSL